MIRVVVPSLPRLREEGHGHPCREIVFTLRAPCAGCVVMCGDFGKDVPHLVRMHRSPKGLWVARLALPPGFYSYRLLVDGAWADAPDAHVRTPQRLGTGNAAFPVVTHPGHVTVSSEVSQRSHPAASVTQANEGSRERWRLA